MAPTASTLALSLVLNGILFVSGGFVANVSEPDNPGTDKCAYTLEIYGNDVYDKRQVPCSEGDPFVFANDNYVLFENLKRSIFGSRKRPATLVEFLDGECRRHTYKFKKSPQNLQITTTWLWSFTCNSIKEEMIRVRNDDADKFVVNVKAEYPETIACFYSFELSGKGVLDKRQFSCSDGKPVVAVNENFAWFENSKRLLFATKKRPGTTVELYEGGCRRHTYKIVGAQTEAQITTNVLGRWLCGSIRREIAKAKSTMEPASYINIEEAKFVQFTPPWRKRFM